MFGGLKKSASRLAIVAAAGVLSTGAMAADLGGDCCADLEERVAELEATTARKGNRRMSLTVYGWVNKAIMHYNAPSIVGLPSSGTYLGQDNTNSATRFGFRGDAKVTPAVKAGYSILLDVASGARTATSTRQVEEQGGSSGFSEDHAVRMRDANVWLEHSAAGRVTLGRLTGAGAVATIDLGGIGNVAPGGFLSGTFLSFANGVTIAQATDALIDYGYRQDGVKWDSPTFAGFTVSASVGETLKKNNVALDQGMVYGVNLRYAGEFSGIRVAAGIGHEFAADSGTPTPSGGNSGWTAHTGGSLALMHAPSGLFIQGAYAVLERGTPVTKVLADRNNTWNVQAGISQNWTGIGKTALYGEYHKHSHNQVQALPVFYGGVALAAGTLGDTKVWGLGMTQDIDAAAMQLYAGYRSHSMSNGAGVGQGTIGVFLAGARVNF